AMARQSSKSSSVETKILSCSKNAAGSPARPTTSDRRSPRSSRRRARRADTRKRWVVTSRLPAGFTSARLQAGHVDDETVLHVLLHHAVPGLVDLLDGDDLDVAGDALLRAEVEHELRLGHA